MRNDTWRWTFAPLSSCENGPPVDAFDSSGWFADEIVDEFLFKKEFWFKSDGIMASDNEMGKMRKNFDSD